MYEAKINELRERRLVLVTQHEKAAADLSRIIAEVNQVDGAIGVLTEIASQLQHPNGAANPVAPIR